MKKLLIFFLVLLLSGCCVLRERGTKQRVNIYTNAGSGAHARITDKKGMVVWEGDADPSFRTSLFIIKKWHFAPEKYTVEISKDGYETGYEVVDWHVSNWYIFGNLLTLGIGYIIDPLFGNIFYLDEEKNVYMPESGSTLSFTGEE